MNVRDFIGEKKELSIQKLKKLPPGTQVVCHQMNSAGKHTTQTMVVKQSGIHKVLVYTNSKGFECVRQIKTVNASVCYTEM